MIRPVLELAAYVELALCWIAWSACFIRPYRESAHQRVAGRNPVALWGILLNVLGCACVWLSVRPAGFHKSGPSLAASMVLGPLSVALAWAATRRLGKNWRFQAVVNKDHELVKTGPYRRIRHPIYASTIGMLLTTGAAYSWWPMCLIGLAIFLVGLEIRVQAEDRLLEMYFQDEFIEYRSRVWGYIPFLR